MKRIFDANAVTLDGRLDEPVWESATTYTGFRTLRSQGGELSPEQTAFKILNCGDSIIVGVRCELGRIREQLERDRVNPFIWGSNGVEIFLSPTGNSFEMYHFILTMLGKTYTAFYSENGAIQPDPYAPDWSYGIHIGDTFWSAEIAFPLTAFYMTSQGEWSDKWLFNMCRNIAAMQAGEESKASSWSELVSGYHEADRYRTLTGCPMRPADDDMRISSATVTLTSSDADGFGGTLTAEMQGACGGEYLFSTAASEEIAVALQPGANTVSVPCRFAGEGRHYVTLQLKRVSDGKVFKREYPVRVAYEPIRVSFTSPEYRTNFYPGQDATKICGRVEAEESCTLTLVGPGIPETTVTPAADGSFCFATPGFEYGDAVLTVRAGSETLEKKIRRLPPTGHTMTWISGGNLIINGKPTLRRSMYAEGYRGGEAFRRRYALDDLHQTPNMAGVVLEPFRLIPGADSPSGEARRDAPPSEAMLQKVQALIDENRDKDFVYYYLSDEPECRQVSSVYLQYIYDYVTERDPYHVVLTASREAASYINCFDWVETHAYIKPQVSDGKRFYGVPMNGIGRYIDSVVTMHRSDKCIGFLPTCFSYKYKSPIADYPTFDEMNCHVWAALVAGAKSLWPFAYLDMNDRASVYEGTRFTNASAEALEDFLLLGERTELLRTQDAHAVRIELDGEKMFALVNFTSQPQTVTLEGLSGSWHNFRCGGMLSGNRFDLKPFEVIIGTSEVRDAGLPTYEEAAALVDELEYARTHTGNLLFAREADVAFSDQSARRYAYKFFDGVHDNFAWSANPAEGVQLAMDISKVKPVFTKLVAHGWQISDMELAFVQNGEISAAPLCETATEEFSKTFVFTESVSPDGLQFTFHGDYVELYEIEVF